MTIGAESRLEGPRPDFRAPPTRRTVSPDVPRPGFDCRRGNQAPAGRLGAATGAAQLSRNVGATLGYRSSGRFWRRAFQLMLKVLGNPSMQDREALAAALRPVFLFGIPLMAAVTVIASGIPHLPLSTDVSHESAIRTDPEVPR